MLICIAVCGLHTKAKAAPFGDFQQNLRVTPDTSLRVMENEGEHETVSALGLDLHKVFTYGQHDVATLVFQPYLLHFSEAEIAPYFFDGNRTDLTWRITNLNFHLDKRRRINLKLGHFEIPFGLEYEIDTNGTLRQYSFNERAIKVDWGVTLNGALSRWNYELAVSRGSGNEYSDSDDTYVISGHLGQQWDRPFAFGLSFFDGRVRSDGKPIESRFIGLNTSYRYARVELLSELSVGEKVDIEDDIVSLLLEASWVNRNETLRLYIQQRERWASTNNENHHENNSIFGYSYQINRLFETSGEWRKNGSEDSFVIQGRFRI